MIDEAALHEWLLREIRSERETFNDYSPYHLGRIDAFICVGEQFGVLARDDADLLALLAE